MIMLAVAIVGLFAFAVLVIDGAMLMTTKNQLQAAADAAALAGASGLVEGSEATATDRAIRFASYNVAVQDTRRPVIISEDDITFPEAKMIRVRTHRTEATGDPLRTYFMRIVNTGSANVTDVSAIAAARFFDVCEADCIKPWAIPDRWDDVNGNGALEPGELYDPDITGYSAPGDVGASIILKSEIRSSPSLPDSSFPSTCRLSIAIAEQIPRPARPSTSGTSRTAIRGASHPATACRSSRATWSDRPGTAWKISSPPTRTHTGARASRPSKGPTLD